MTEDYLYREQQKATDFTLPAPTAITNRMFEHCLLDINDILADHNIDLRDIDSFAGVFPQEDTRLMDSNGDGLSLLARTHIQLSLSAEAYDTIRTEIVNDSTRDLSASKLYFIDAPGGSGKTFLFNSLLNSTRRVGDIAIAVASSGIAALLLEGGRTSHSTFKILIDINTESMCNIKPRSELGNLIKKAKLIVWDEASMTSITIFEAVDRTFKDIMKDENHVLQTVLFGGKLIVFGGDFRQVLPVIPKACRSTIVNECLNPIFLMVQGYCPQATCKYASTAGFAKQ